MVAPAITGTITPIGARYLDATTGNNLATAPSYPSVATCGFSTSTTSPLLGTGRQSTFTQAGSWTVARWEGGGWDISPSINGTGGLFCGHIAPAQNNGRFTLARVALRSGVGNWRAWQVWDNATFSTDNYPHKFSGNFFPFVIDAASTGSYSDVGTFNITAIDRIEVHYWVTSNATYSTSQDEFVFLKDIAITQGDSGNIATLESLASNTLGTNTMLFNKQGGTGFYYSYFPVNLNPDYFQQSFTLRYPASVPSCFYTSTSLSASFATGSGDLIDIKDSIIQSNSPVVLSSSLNAGSTRNFSRLIVATNGGTSTFGSNYTQTGGTFSGRGRIDCQGTLTNVLIANSTASNGALLLRTTAAITGCTFSGNAVAIAFQSSGSYDISSHTFSGNTVDLLADGVTATVTVTAAQSSALTKSEINGGSITLVSPTVTVTLTGLATGTEVRVYNAGTSTEAAGIEATASSTFSFSGTVGSSYDIEILSLLYKNQFIAGFTFPSASTSVPVSQQLDRDYLNP